MTMLLPDQRWLLPVPASAETLYGPRDSIARLLQRDGRLVDFRFEDVAVYSDAQVGAAVQEVHASCR